MMYCDSFLKHHLETNQLGEFLVNRLSCETKISLSEVVQENYLESFDCGVKKLRNFSNLILRGEPKAA